jgi:hypothetical protein
MTKLLVLLVAIAVFIAIVEVFNCSRSHTDGGGEVEAIPHSLWGVSLARASTTVAPGANITQQEYECGLRMLLSATAYQKGDIISVLEPTSQLPGWRGFSTIELDADQIQLGGLQLVLTIQDENADFQPRVLTSSSSATEVLNATPRVLSSNSSSVTGFSYAHPVSLANPGFLGRDPSALLRVRTQPHRGTDYVGSLKSSINSPSSSVVCRFIDLGGLSSASSGSSPFRANASHPTLNISHLQSVAPVGASLVCDFSAYPAFRPTSDEMIYFYLPITSTNGTGAFQPDHVCFGYAQRILQVQLKSSVVSPFATVSVALAAIATAAFVVSSMVAPEGHIIELQQATTLLMNECASATDRSAVEWASYFVVSPFGAQGAFLATLLNFTAIAVVVMLLQASVVTGVWLASSKSFKSICATLRFPSLGLAVWLVMVGGASYYGGVAMADNNLPTVDRVGSGIVTVLSLVGYMSIALFFRIWGTSSGGGGSSGNGPKQKPHVWEADKIKPKHRTCSQSLSLLVLPRTYLVPRTHYFRWMSAYGGSRMELATLGYVIMSFVLPLHLGIMSVASDRSMSCATLFIVTTLEALALTVGLGFLQPNRSTMFNIIPVLMGALLFLISGFEVIGNYSVSATLDALKPVMYMIIAFLTIARSVVAFVLYFVEERRFEKAEADKKQRAAAESIAAAQAGAAAALTGGASGGAAAGIISAGFTRPKNNNESAPISSPVRALAQFHESGSEHTDASVVGEHLNESSAYSQMESYASAATSSFALEGGSVSSMDPRNPSTRGRSRGGALPGATIGGGPHRRRRKVAGGASVSFSGGSSASLGSLASSNSMRSSRRGGARRKGGGGPRGDVIIDPNLVQRDGGGYGYAYQSQWLEVDNDDAFEDAPPIDGTGNQGDDNDFEDEYEDEPHRAVYMGSDDDTENSPVAPAIIGHL